MRICAIHSAVAILFLAVAPSVVFSQGASAANPKVSVHLPIARRTFRAGDPIHVGVRVSNRGDEPILIANSVSIASGGTSYLNLELKDVRGRISPATRMIIDFPIQSDENALLKLLSSLVLLKPNTSLLFEVPIDS